VLPAEGFHDLPFVTPIERNYAEVIGSASTATITTFRLGRHVIDVTSMSRWQATNTNPSWWQCVFELRLFTRLSWCEAKAIRRCTACSLRQCCWAVA